MAGVSMVIFADQLRAPIVLVKMPGVSIRCFASHDLLTLRPVGRTNKGPSCPIKTHSVDRSRAFYPCRRPSTHALGVGKQGLGSRIEAVDRSSPQWRVVVCEDQA